MNRSRGFTRTDIPWSTMPCSTGSTGLKVISNYGVGVDHIDVEAAAARHPGGKYAWRA